MKTASRIIIGSLSVVALLSSAYFVAQREDTRHAADPSVSAGVPLVDLTAPPAAEVTATELRSALTAVCATDDAAQVDEERTQEEFQAQIDALSASLSVSATPEHLLLAAWLENDMDARAELLEQAISLSPTDPFLLWSAVRECSDSADSLGCPLGDWERRLTAVDGQNSETWIRIAANRYAAGETDAALEAMKRAATAPETRIFWTESIEMVERGLAAARGDLPFHERAAMAFSMAGAMLPSYGDYTKMCVEQSSLSVEWTYTCLEYGELAEDQGKTVIGVSIARSMQKLALESLGEATKAVEVEHRLQRNRRERLSADPKKTELIERVLFSNATLFSTYLAATRSIGEQAAQRKIATEIERLIEQQPGLACQ